MRSEIRELHFQFEFRIEKLKSGLSARATKYSGRALFAFGHFLARKARQKWFETAFFGSTNI